ncbi:hypothetical protein ACFV7Q_38925, partial [Streptomyces sp. NPDC059851]|uniref:hypothetical protein n=1 Tax=Streptomyces sp. NPDC059851 TaxID=3346971 RepID=UPI00366A03C1
TDVRHPAQQPEGLARCAATPITRSVATLKKLNELPASDGCPPIHRGGEVWSASLGAYACAGCNAGMPLPTAVKAIWALGGIPSEEAWDALEGSRDAENEIIRENAVKQLARRGEL